MRTLTAALSERRFRAPAVTAEMEAEARAFEERERREAVRMRLAGSGVPARFLSPFPGDTPAAVSRWVASFDASTERGLLLTGGYGTGKTHIACNALAALADRWGVAFATAPGIVERAGIAAAGLDGYRDVRVLCIDDLGKERPTEYAMERLYSIIDWRYGRGRPTIYTTNYGSDGLWAHFTKIADAETAGAMMSRIVGTCDMVAVRGRDMRGR